MELIISLLSGAVGGNLAGSLLKKISLGTLWNSVVGIIGGGLGGKLLETLGVLGQPEATMSVGSIIANVLSSGVGGGVLMAIVSFIKKAFAK